MGEILEFPERAADRSAEAPEPLWRELVGRELHRERTRRGERLVDVAQRAGVSVQYLSEIERGLKDPSSEMLHAVAGALELGVRELAGRVNRSDASCLAA
ncbi:helix-turn-helix transcriptional regulator [Nocardioides sp. zg-1308]|uniref:Helix-turn-helix transcriptional regulator n=1 Tax=Nocardioides renjunii TaxID=3095075 RepID=A0ABU5K9E7_9ACTN|nr:MULTISPECIES: helix-turn-helix transcriptional regulator [unclassified Nocardioides]MDZ5661590.1 helix-turn-helix transcriptional regulator [Nocardioides sp. S-58]NPD04695.1 helix-turn-helix transcriptional regulator [Nocardioides sp. zg-1308]WQQ22588.1 helix-turn-helix transcriptional regulator [Nocardioides sp. S-34]